jgi:hypothetical protein
MVDRRESVARQLVSLNALLDGRQATIWTTMPGVLQSFDATKMTCSVQLAVQAQTRDPYGTWSNVSISVLTDCPVSFPRGGGYGCTFPLVGGDEGLVHFSARCMDAWWQSGGVQPQAEFRMHDLSDGFFVPGVVSQPHVPAGVSTTTARFWAEDGSQYVELDKPNGNVNIHAAAKVQLVCPGGLWVNGVMVTIP